MVPAAGAAASRRCRAAEIGAQIDALSAGQDDIARKYLQMPAALVALPFDRMTLNDIGCADRKAFR